MMSVVRPPGVRQLTDELEVKAVDRLLLLLLLLDDDDDDDDEPPPGSDNLEVLHSSANNRSRCLRAGHPRLSQYRPGLSRTHAVL